MLKKSKTDVTISLFYGYCGSENYISYTINNKSHGFFYFYTTKDKKLLNKGFYNMGVKNGHWVFDDYNKIKYYL